MRAPPLLLQQQLALPAVLRTAAVTRMRMRPLFRVRRMVGVGLANSSTKIVQRSGGGSLLLRARSLELHFP